jgi:hypothetical protein
MPRYFFHQRIGDRMMWDGTGLELPDLGLVPDPDQAAALWTEIIEGRLQPGRILVITSETGQVLFVVELYSITSSARARRVVDIERPSALAVLRLITISNAVGCSTGSSAAFAPVMI